MTDNERYTQVGSMLKEPPFLICHDCGSVVWDRSKHDLFHAALGDHHYVVFNSGGWSVQHSLTCRMTHAAMQDCEIHALVVADCADGQPLKDGRYRVVLGRSGLEWHDA